MVPETGVIMNNEMNDFSLPDQSNSFGYAPSPANFIKPGKRPLSSISPTIVEHKANNSLYYVIGSAGGSRIITATIQNLWHVLDQGKTVPESLKEARLHDQLRYVLSFLKRLFHEGLPSNFSCPDDSIISVITHHHFERDLHFLMNAKHGSANTFQSQYCKLRVYLQ